MSLNFNKRGELIENVMITDDMVFIIQERKYTPSEMYEIRIYEQFMDDLEEIYGTLNMLELMDRGISKKDTLRYLFCRKRLHDLEWTSEKDIV